MASSYSTNLRLELPVDGELSGSWGARINAGITEMIEDALSAETSITTTTGETILTEINGAADTARNVFLDIDGTLVGNVTITIPDLNKFYLVRNATTEDFTVTIKPSSTGALITQGETALVYCAGTTCFVIGPALAGHQFTNLEIGAASDSTLARDSAGVLSVEGNVLYAATGLDVPVTDGGTGVSTLTNHGVVLGQAGSAVAVTGAGTAGEVLTSNGASSDPTFQTMGGLQSLQTFTGDGTWTKPAGLVRAKVIVVGGGGGGGGAGATSGTDVAAADGGGGGGTSIELFEASELGATETVTVGTGGAGGIAGNNIGTVGETTEFGATPLMQATGGGGGGGAPPLASDRPNGAGSTGGVGTLGDINFNGGGGGAGFASLSGSVGQGGKGGDSSHGAGGNGGLASGSTSGTVGKLYGGGGSGASNGKNQIAVAGSAGADGIVYVWEYY